MSIFNTTIYLPPVPPPKMDLELNESTIFADDRLKIAEVEAAFEEFESELSLQLHRQISPVGKRLTAIPPNVDELVSTSANNQQRHSVSHGTLPSPIYNLPDSSHLDGEFHDLGLSSMFISGPRSSSARLPRRIGGTRFPPYTPSAPPLNRINPYPVGASVDDVSNILGDLAAASSVETPATIAVRDTGSNEAPTTSLVTADDTLLTTDTHDSSDEAQPS